MLRIFSTPNTSVSPSATMNSHDASISPSMRMVSARFIKPQLSRHPEEPRTCAASRRMVEGTGACGPPFEARRKMRRAPQDDGGAGLADRDTLVALRAGHAALDPVQRLD